MKIRRFAYTALLVGLWCGEGTAPALAQSAVKEFVPFQKFIESTQAPDSAESIPPGSRVKDAAALEEMRQHILTMYRGVEVNHSFVTYSNHFDCIPIAQQPTVKAFGITSIAPAPPQSVLTQSSSADDPSEFHASPASQLSDEKQTDEFGNTIGCEQGTIPMRRITLEQMTQFSTLREFFQKGPGTAGRPAAPQTKAAPETSGPAHKYSIAFQNVDNLGGSSNLNLWSPPVNTSWGEIMSLSQEWYVGGSGTSEQTAEVGWQNYPQVTGNEESRLFIYWTADGYNTTGCYNLECPAFVQVTNSRILGGGFNRYSTHGGAQYEITARYYLYRGNWWLAIQGTWIGYYPGAVYRGGQLTHFAQIIEFGTEGVGTTVWPAEGSGYWSTSGFDSAAYQRNLFYTNLAGNAVKDTLTGYDPSPGCYSTSGPFSSSSSGVYFFEGGPGGPGC
jgi:hypothetical protein